MSEAGGDQREKLGVIIGKLEGIEHRLDGIDTRLDAAERSRKEMYARFDQHNADVANLRLYLERQLSAGRRSLRALAERVGGAEDKLARAVTVMERVEDYEKGARAAGTVASFLGRRLKWVLAVGGAALLAFWRELLALIRG